MKCIDCEVEIGPHQVVGPQPRCPQHLFEAWQKEAASKPLDWNRIVAKVAQVALSAPAYFFLGGSYEQTQGSVERASRTDPDRAA